MSNSPYDLSQRPRKAAQIGQNPRIDKLVADVRAMREEIATLRIEVARLVAFEKEE
jgi:hypothetical protein